MATASTTVTAATSPQTNDVGSSYASRYNYQCSLRKNSSASFLIDSSSGLNGGAEPDRQSSLTSVHFEYSLSDVYDDAAVIGSELEKIINNYGSDVLKDLMPKVIKVLELLESLTMKKESESDELNEMRVTLSSLEMEKAQRTNEREKFEKELEEIEEKWKQETLKLINMVNKLKEENKRLNDSLDENNSQSLKNDDHFGIFLFVFFFLNRLGNEPKQFLMNRHLFQLKLI